MATCAYKTTHFSAKEGQLMASIAFLSVKGALLQPTFFETLLVFSNNVGVGELAYAMGKKSLSSADNKALKKLVSDGYLEVGKTEKRSYKLSVQGMAFFGLSSWGI